MTKKPDQQDQDNKDLKTTTQKASCPQGSGAMAEGGGCDPPSDGPKSGFRHDQDGQEEGLPTASDVSTESNVEMAGPVSSIHFTFNISFHIGKGEKKP